MASLYHVRLKPGFQNDVQQWAEDDQNVLLGFIAALEDHGFDVIGRAGTDHVPGLTVEFIEPGETPDMVWARLYLELSSGLVTLTVHWLGNDIVLDGK